MFVERIVRLSVCKTNYDPLVLLDHARRLADRCGPAGIKAKRGQTDRRLQEKGYLRLRFPSQAVRRRFLNLVEMYADPSITVRLFKRRRRRHRR